MSDLIDLADVQDVLSPVFDPAMGKRLRLARMNLFMDQIQLSERLGTSASTISDLENGKLSISRKPIRLAKLREVFGEHLGFLLLGWGAERYVEAEIRKAYWYTKDYVERDRTTSVSGEDHWFNKRHQKRLARKGKKSDA